MATVKKAKTTLKPRAATSKAVKKAAPLKTSVKPAAKAAKASPSSPKSPGAEKPKPSATGAPKKNGLIVFSVVAGLVVLLAVVGKLRQGPPLKVVPSQLLATFSSESAEIGPLGSPRGLAVDAEGNVFVADLANHRMVKFSPDGQVATAWGKKGEAAGEFNEPSGCAVDRQGNVFVADTWNGRIQKFNGQGEYLGEISSKSGNFYSPRNMTVANDNYIYVADTGNSCVKKFDLDANLVKRWGEYGSGRDRFRETFGIYVDDANQVYVGDAGNKRVKIFTADGKFIREIRVKGWQEGVGWPMMAVDSRGYVYAVDGQNSTVWIYDREGKYQGSWVNAPGKDLFSSPLGIALDRQGNVYVSNMNRGQIVKLAGYSPR